MAIEARHRLAVEALALAGGESVLEIGCGHGVATRLAIKQLTSGRITALDRSAKMIALVRAASAEALGKGQLVTRTDALEDADFGSERFDAIFAVNVDLNLRLGDRWAPMLAKLLEPGGRVVLAFDPPPGSKKTAPFSALSRKRLEEAGFSAEAHTDESGVTVFTARLS